MAKYLTVAELTAVNQKLRNQTAELTRRAARSSEEIERAKAQAEERYSALPTRERRQYVAREVAATSKRIVAEFNEGTKGILRDIEALSTEINAAREFYENPFKRLNVLTAMDPKMAGRRAEVSAMLVHAGPAEIETLADAFRSTRDFGGMAALVSRNSKIPASERKLHNAAIVAGVDFPDADQVAAIRKRPAEAVLTV